jgi:hypothetical protein
MNEKTKTLKLNLDAPDERILWEWLKRLPHGDFSHKTKRYWLEQMKKEKEN